MKQARVRIVVTPNGIGTQVFVDGHEIKHLRAVRVSAGVDGPSRVSLEFVAEHVEIEGDVGVVEVTDLQSTHRQFEVRK